MGRGKSQNKAGMKRKANNAENTNSNSTKIDQLKRSKNVTPKSVVSKVNKNIKFVGNEPKEGNSGKRGKLTPKRLEMSSERNNEENEAVEIPNNTSQVDQVHTGHGRISDQGRSTPRSTLVDVHREADVIQRVNCSVNSENNQESGDEEAMAQDGVCVEVPESEDEFTAEYERDNNAHGSQQGSQERAAFDNEDSDPEISLSTKKSFLRKELQWDPRLREVFDELAKDGQTQTPSRCAVKDS